MDTGKGKARGGQKLLIVLFLLVLFVPAVLGALSAVSGAPLDVPLKGYTEEHKMPALSLSAWLNGSLQADFSAWFVEKIRPRGVMIKTYNTANLLLFHKKEGMVIGRGYDLIEKKYVDAELGLQPEDDFSDPANVARLSAYVASLEKLHRLLKAHGKTLVYYIGPSKASAHRKDLPARYEAVSTHPARGADVMRSLLEKTDIPFLVCADLEKDLAYPSFYTTGIHWSRVYEQTASRALIALASRASGKRYRNIVLGDIESSRVPFDRDTDLLDLANVFYRPSLTYYQYHTELENPEEYDNLRVLIQGDSFALGLRNDLIANDPDAEVYFITRNESVVDRNDQFLVLYYDWNNMDWHRYLDNVDVVILEAAEPLVGECSFGFVDALCAALEAGGDW